MTPVRTARVLLGAAGAGLMAYGTARLFQDPLIPDHWDVVRWAAGALLLHDAGFAVAVYAIGALVMRTRPRSRPGPGSRRIVLAGLAAGTAATVIALPALLAPRPAANPTVLPLDYPRNLAVVWAVVAAATAAALVVRRARRPPD